MKAYKMTDLLKKDSKSLSEDIVKLQNELNEVKVKATTRKMSDDSSEAKKIRKQIARVQTALHSPAPVIKEKTSVKKEEK